MQLKSLILLLALLFLSSHSFAVSPDIRLPEWYKCDFGIADWSPDQRILTVRAAISATRVDLHSVSCRLEQKLSKPNLSEIKEHKLVKKGDKAVFLFRLQVDNECKGWLNFDLRARPDEKGMLAAIAELEAKPLTNKVLENEIMKLKQPIMLGQSLPVFVAPDIAIGVTAEIAFRPFTLAEQSVYLWLPEERFGTGIKAESFKALKKAVDAGQHRSAAAACTLIINKLAGDKAGLKAEPRQGEVFEIPGSVAIDLLTLNRATFIALEKGDSTELKQLSEQLKSGYVKAFACFNLARICIGKKDKAKAKALLKQALELIPTWPVAAVLQEKMSK